MKALTVNYNTPDFLERMLTGFRKFYDIEIIVIDGSDERFYPQIKKIVENYGELHHFDFNIHHGPGMAYGFNYLKDDRIMVIDSDVIFYRGGAIERLNAELRNDSYGIGDIQTVDDAGFNKPVGIKYLHPAFMLVNREVVMRYPMPIKHGAPMIETMKAIHAEGADILQHAEYVTNDFRNKNKIYIRHDWMGTVNRTGGYHL